MVCGLEIAMLIFGIMALATGKLKMSKTKAAVGMPARLAGVILVIPLPLAFAVGFVMGFTGKYRAQAIQHYIGSIQSTEIAIVLLCLAAAGLILWRTAKPIETPPANDTYYPPPLPPPLPPQNAPQDPPSVN